MGDDRRRRAAVRRAAALLRHARPPGRVCKLGPYPASVTFASIVDGGGDNDVIAGNEGDDELRDGLSEDRDGVRGGEGADEIDVDDGDGDDVVECGARPVEADPKDNVDPRCERVID